MKPFVIKILANEAARRCVNRQNPKHHHHGDCFNQGKTVLKDSLRILKPTTPQPYSVCLPNHIFNDWFTGLKKALNGSVGKRSRCNKFCAADGTNAHDGWRDRTSKSVSRGDRSVGTRRDCDYSVTSRETTCE